MGWANRAVYIARVQSSFSDCLAKSHPPSMADGFTGVVLISNNGMWNGVGKCGDGKRTGD